MSPVCPRCGGELRPASINAWVHVWQDKEDDCYMRGKDGVPVLATGSIGERVAPVPANPDDVGVQKEPSHSVVGGSLLLHFRCTSCNRRLLTTQRCDVVGHGDVCHECYVKAIDAVERDLHPFEDEFRSEKRVTEALR